MRLAWALPFVLAACSTDDIVLATDIQCARSVDCPLGSHCERLACGDAVGFCKQTPAQCSEEEVIVCGCDGVSYVNDCVRGACGAAASTNGACPGWEGPPSSRAACFRPIIPRR